MLLNLYISHDQQDQMPFENQMTQWPCSGPWHYSMHMSLMSASVVFDPGVVPNCLGSTFTKIAGFAYCLTTNSSATFDSTGVRVCPQVQGLQQSDLRKQIVDDISNK